MVRAGVDELLQEFRDSTTGQQLLDCAEADGRCKPAALALLALLHEHGMTEAELLNFNRPGSTHYVVELDGMIIDPSVRQFREHATADVPRVVPYASFATEWDGDPLRVNFTNVWDARHVHKVGDRPPQWRSAAKGLPARAPAGNGAEGCSTG